MKFTALKTAAVVAGLVAISGAAHASTVTGSLSDWKAAVGTFAETTTLGVDGATITGFTTTDGVSVTNDAATVHTVGLSWSTWSGGYTGQLLNNPSTSVAFTLGSAVNGFGLFVEPDPFEVHDITLTTSDGQVLTQAVNGTGGALFFGWTGAGVTGFTLSSDVDFGAGDVFSSAGAGVPEPATWALMLGGFGLVGATLRRRHNVALAA